MALYIFFRLVRSPHTLSFLLLLCTGVMPARARARGAKTKARAAPSRGTAGSFDRNSVCEVQHHRRGKPTNNDKYELLATGRSLCAAKTKIPTTNSPAWFRPKKTALLFCFHGENSTAFAWRGDAIGMDFVRGATVSRRRGASTLFVPNLHHRAPPYDRPGCGSPRVSVVLRRCLTPLPLGLY